MEDNFDFSALKKKKRKNSRTKGNTFERKVCGILNEHFNTTDFNRSPGSGAFANTHKLPDHLKVYGDLLTPLNFKYIIECKKGYNKEGLGSLFNKRSDIYNFIKQASDDARKIQKKWIVIFQQDRKDTLAILPYDDIVSTSAGIEYHIVMFGDDKDGWNIIMKLEDLLKLTTLDFWTNNLQK